MSLGWESGLLDMGLSIWQAKISPVLHIRSPSIETLARQIYDTQKERKWPGLAMETAYIYRWLEVDDCNTTIVDCVNYKKDCLISLSEGR